MTFETRLFAALPAFVLFATSAAQQCVWELFDPLPAPLESFGNRVATNGDRAAVSEGGPASQDVHLYERAGSTWVQTTTIDGPVATGFAADMAGAGDVLVIA